MIENFPKLLSDNEPQIQEAQRTPNRINAKTKQNKTKNSTISRYIICKLQKIKNKQKVLREAKENKYITEE